MVETMGNPLKVEFPFTVPTPLIERLKATNEAEVEAALTSPLSTEDPHAVNVVA